LRAPRMLDASACVAAHDAANVIALSALSCACACGLAGALSARLVTAIFIAYILLDGAWIALWPRAVPSGARLVVTHHAVTMVLLAHAARHPERAMETCRNGLVEANTLFLILRRRATRGTLAHRAWNLAYVGTLVPVRFVWQPYLFARFVELTSGDDFLERFSVLGSQAFLLGFNVWLVARRRASAVSAKTKDS